VSISIYKNEPPNIWALVGNWLLKGVSFGTLLSWVPIVFYRTAKMVKKMKIPQRHGVQRTPV
jgi:hypothetical protein